MTFKVPTEPGEIRKIILENLALSAAINDIERLAVKNDLDIHPILDRHGIKYRVTQCFEFGGKET